LKSPIQNIFDFRKSVVRTGFSLARKGLSNSKMVQSSSKGVKVVQNGSCVKRYNFTSKKHEKRELLGES